MPIRTTPDRIKSICKVKASHDLTEFIEAANQLVDDLCLESEYSDAKLARIETWLAAHFYCILAPRRRTENVGQLQSTIESMVDLGLNVTRYGQMAMQIDTAGNLAANNNKIDKILPKKISALWLGTPPPDQLTEAEVELEG